MMAKNRSYDVLKHLWVEWRKASGNNYKKDYLDFIQMNNDGAQSLGNCCILKYLFTTIMKSIFLYIVFVPLQYSNRIFIFGKDSIHYKTNGLSSMKQQTFQMMCIRYGPRKRKSREERFLSRNSINNCMLMFVENFNIFTINR